MILMFQNLAEHAYTTDELKALEDEVLTTLRAARGYSTVRKLFPKMVQPAQWYAAQILFGNSDVEKTVVDLPNKDREFGEFAYRWNPKIVAPPVVVVVEKDERH